MHGTRAERGKPAMLLVGGKWAARLTDSMAGRGGGKKQKPVCNRLDRGCNITSRESAQTSLWSFGARAFE
jgi:hypothetical protein